jgi:ribose 5-phosphate isomerase A
MSASMNELKQRAAAHAVTFIESGMKVGLGHGSTALYAVQALAGRLRNGELQEIAGIPASKFIGDEAKRLGIPLTTFADHPVIDLTIDGADEVDPALNLIKGGGGALLREKIIAQASRREIIVVDGSKLVPALGTNWALPVEVVPFGWEAQARYLAALGAEVTARREEDGKLFETDQGNYILDCAFGVIEDLMELNTRLNDRVGIVEHGLFLGLASDVIVADQDGLRHLRAG